QLAALAKERVPTNTIKNTEGWINIMNQWQSDVNYKEPLENQDKETIELQVSQFLCGVTTKSGGRYSRTSLKNALSAINRHLQNIKPDFPNLYAQFDGLLKDMKKKGLGEFKSTDRLTTEEIQHILIHEVLDPNTLLGLLKRVFFWISILGAARGSGIEENQFNLVIPFLSDSEDISGPNADLRNIMELFNIGVSENTGCAISRHKFSGGYYAYAKPTDSHKREALANILNKLINITETTQNSIINTTLLNKLVQDSLEYNNPEPDDNEELRSIRSDDDELSDVDLNNSAQEQNEHEFYGKFHTA
ncbi:2575_t:CDS:2, partial [Racocetra fulgida]